MRRVCGEAVVGRSIPLRRVLLRGMQRGIWKQFYDHEYCAKLIGLASVGNPEVCFYAGMRAVFVKDHDALMPRLDMLERSATADHDFATFVLSLVLHKSNYGAGNDNIARRLLRKVEGDEAGPAVNVTWKKKICTRCLQHAMLVLEDIAGRPTLGQCSPLSPLAMPVRRQDRH